MTKSTGTYPFPSSQEGRLAELGMRLRNAGYRFITVTPETHRTVNERAGISTAFDLRDVFGWNRRFRIADIPAELEPLLDAADVLVEDGPVAVSNVRYSTIGESIFAHSAYPTSSEDCVFFGPDTYRFVQFIIATPVHGTRVAHRDVGCGAAPAGLDPARAAGLASGSCRHQSQAPNIRASMPTRVGGRGRVRVERRSVQRRRRGRPRHLNPPYMQDSAKRQYRDGGDNHGTALSVRIAKESLARLSTGGRLLLYTGAPVVAGTDLFLEAMTDHLQRIPCTFTYAEIDPDVFGEELRNPGYERVERIAAVGLVVDLH